MIQLMRAELKAGRGLFVNGVPELTLEHKPLEDPNRWHEAEVVADGSVIVIDEVQRIWRAQETRVTPSIAALETHRHRGLDFILVTQHPNLLHPNVRRLVSRHIHLRDIGILGRWWYEWPEATNPETFKSAPVKKKFSLPKSSFDAYKSATVHTKVARTIPPALYALGLAIPLLAWLAFSVFTSIKAKAQTPAVSASAQSTGAPGLAGANVNPPQTQALASPREAYQSEIAVSRPAAKEVEPYEGMTVHLIGSVTTGSKTVPFFALAVDSRVVAALTLQNVTAAGYTWRTKPGSLCYGELVFGEQKRIVRCDLPLRQQAAPLDSKQPQTAIDPTPFKAPST
jgi:zona occludens toxin (predicted ATPase)